MIVYVCLSKCLCVGENVCARLGACVGKVCLERKCFCSILFSFCKINMGDAV